MPSYDPEVIERFAAQLERRAKAVRRGFTAGGLVLGGLFGSIPLTPLGRAWPIPHIFGFTTFLVGLCVGALIGWVVGEGRAEMYRLHAQTTLCQLHAQRTSLAIWRLLQERGESPSVPAVEPEFEFEFEPELEPEPAEELEPVLAPTARLAAPPPPAYAAPPAPVEPPTYLEPPADFDPPASLPAPTPAQPPARTPMPAAARATPSMLRPAGTPAAPPVSPPPVSG